MYESSCCVGCEAGSVLVSTITAVQIGKRKADPVHTMSTCRRSGGIVPLALNLGTVCRLTSPAALPPHPHNIHRHLKCRKTELS